MHRNKAQLSDRGALVRALHLFQRGIQASEGTEARSILEEMARRGEVKISEDGHFERVEGKRHHIPRPLRRKVEARLIKLQVFRA